MKIRNLIIGAGPAGLGAAYRLKELRENDFLILERNPWIGGLAASFVDAQGFTWDIGGHVQFSHYPYFDRVMDEALPSGGWLSHQRESWVWMYDRFVPYPFQNNVHYLPEQARWECLRGLLETAMKPVSAAPRTFEEWIIASFGRGVAKEFMLPYNYKVWAYPPKQMAYQWIGERVATTDVFRVLENMVFGRMDASWGPNNLFKFPKEGGTGAIWRSVGRLVGEEKIRLNTKVVKVDADRRIVYLSSGETIHYDRLLSTMPVDVLTGMMAHADRRLSVSKHLKHSSSNIVGVGLRGQPKDELKEKCWMYFPEDNCPFYRVTLFSKYSSKNVPDATTQFSLMTETSESPAKAVQGDKLAEQTIQGLRNTKLISERDEIVSVWTYRADYGYPTPSLERDSILNEVIPILDRQEVYSRGRFGGWKYEVSNQDHSFMQGVEWTNFVMKSEAETTYKVSRAAPEAESAEVPEKQAAVG
jgi:protoporphyrinogen oxidase